MKNYLALPSLPTKAVTLSFSGEVNKAVDPSRLPQTLAVNCYNCNGSKGVMTHNGGVEAYKRLYVSNFTRYPLLPPAGQSFSRLYYCERTNPDTGLNADYIVAVMASGSVYYYDADNLSAAPTSYGQLSALAPTSATVYRLQQQNIMLLASRFSPLAVIDGDSYNYVTNAPNIKSMCIHYERLFALTDQALWFSDDLNPTNWNVALDQAGFIEFADDKGAPVAVLSYLDYLFVFREYGITRVTAYAEQSDFAMTEVCTLSSKIARDTVKICGEYVYFATAEGVYRFNGNGVTKLFPELDGFFVGVGHARAGYVKGKYLLACRTDYGDGEKVLCEKRLFTNNTLLAYDVDSGELQLNRGIDVIDICEANDTDDGGILLVDQGETVTAAAISKNNVLFDQPLQCAYSFAATDLGYPDRKKFVREIVCGNAKIGTNTSLVVTLDGKRKSYRLREGKQICKVKINESAYNVQVSVVSGEKSLRLPNLTLRFNVL